MSYKTSFTTKFNNWIKLTVEEERKHFEKSDNGKVFCNVCCKIFNCTRKYLLDQHIGTATHVNAVRRCGSARQVRVNNVAPTNSFNHDLCKALLAADIPIFKLNNPVLKQFLETYCSRQIPSDWTLRNKNLKECYDEVIQNIRTELEDKYIWMGVDETTDKCGRFVANVVVGCLDGTMSQPRLLMSRELETTDNVTVTQLIMDALHFLWPGKLHAQISKQFAVLLSDAAPYMIKTGKNLKRTFPKLLHVTCVAHGLHRVAETVRSSYGNVDKLVGYVKAVFKKSPQRVRIYNSMLPGLSLLPEPVISRWGTWLEAAEFLAANFAGISNVMKSFDSDDAECVRKAQNLLEKEGIQEQLADISSNYVFLAHVITKFESRNLSIIEAVEHLESVKTTLATNKSNIGAKVFAKLEAVLQKNPDINSMIKVAKVLKGEPKIVTGFEPSLMVALKFCPMTSVELERGFSMEKAILTDRRRNFTMKNIEMHLICHFAMNLGDKIDETGVNVTE